MAFVYFAAFLTSERTDGADVHHIRVLMDAFWNALGCVKLFVVNCSAILVRHCFKVFCPPTTTTLDPAPTLADTYQNVG